MSDYAVEGVKKLTNAGIMQGSDNMFRPADNATRAEAASVIYMIAEYLK
ncbi:S-layer homology domain-containing protein [Eubacterium ventriosum]